MAVYSMTGYASARAGASQAPGETAQGAAGGRAEVTVEIRSVNGRFLDLSLRLPDDLRALEPALRDLVGAACRRGKIELRMNTLADDEAAFPQPNPDQLIRLARLDGLVRNWLPDARSLSVHEALQWCRGGGGERVVDDTALEAARGAIAALREARAREGERLADVLRERVQHLRTLAAQAEPLVPDVVRRQQQRFLERWTQALEAAGAGQTVTGEARNERALGEAAAFALRIDVAEELARLRSHLDEIERLLAAGGELGKRLDFLIQELLREANTLGSKSAALELSALSVEMKVAIEQMREQVQNIE